MPHVSIHLPLIKYIVSLTSTPIINKKVLPIDSCIHIHNWYKLFSPMTDVRVKKYVQMASAELFVVLPSQAQAPEHSFFGLEA